MRKLKTLVIAAVLFLGFNTAVTAQSKIAHIDVSALVPMMPEVKTATEQLKKLGEGFEKDYTAMTTEFSTKAEKYGKEAKTAGDVVNESRGKELQDLENRIMQFQQNAQKELSKKEVELQTPIMEKARLAILKVAKAKGYDYVLDSSTGSGVIMAEGNNLLNDVKAELKIK